MNQVDFWDTRYKSGPGAGNGSTGRLYAFKLETVQSIVDEFGVRSVVDYGCGDGAQLRELRVDEYTGLDVSEVATTEAARHRFSEKWQYCTTAPDGVLDDTWAADMAVSLDVIMHLPPGAYETYMENLFSIADRLVLIYAPNDEHPEWHPQPHMFPRRFTDWIEANTDAELIRHIPNHYPAEVPGVPDTSFSEFFLYEL